jgi:hypothetical protein
MDQFLRALKHQPPIAIVVELLLLVIFLMTPTIVAAIRRNKDLPAIAACNVLFIYAVEIWLPLLVWASTGSKNQGLLDRLSGSRRNAAFAIGLLVATAACAIAGLVALRHMLQAV